MRILRTLEVGGPSGSRLPCTSRRRGFSLIEILAVMAIAVIIGVIAISSLSGVASAGNLTAAATTISQAIEAARTYAMANNTYVWLGFFEEDGLAAAANPAQPGIGRIVMATVASADGTMLYSSSSGAPVTLDPTRLIQVGRLTRVSGAHLQAFPDGSGSGTTFDTRPALASDNARIGLSSLPGGSLPSFQYPVGQAAAQYTFDDVIQFNSQGEAIVSTMAGVLTPLIEIGLQPAHGNVANTASPNVVALQISGTTGTVVLYRR